METELFKVKLINFIQGLCDKSRPDIRVGGDTKLFEDRLVNSIRIIDVIAFVERELQVSIPDDMLNMGYFKSPDVIVAAFAPLRQAS